MAGETTTQHGSTASADATVMYTPKGRDVACHRHSFEVSTGELELNDIIQTLKLPKGALIVDGYLMADDVDTHACPTVTFTVGTDADPDGFLTTSTIGQGGGMARFDGELLRSGTKFTTDDTVDIKVTTAAATAAAGTVTLTVFYINGDDDL